MNVFRPQVRIAHGRIARVTMFGKRIEVLAVHRYIISSITTEQVLMITQRYSDMVYRVNKYIRDLEDEQLRLGVGMTVASKDVPEHIRRKTTEIMRDEADKKHGNPVPAKNLRRTPRRSTP